MFKLGYFSSGEKKKGNVVISVSLDGKCKKKMHDSITFMSFRKKFGEYTCSG